MTETTSRIRWEPSGPAYRPDELLAATADGPDPTGPLVDFELIDQSEGNPVMKPKPPASCACCPNHYPGGTCPGCGHPGH